MTNLKFRHEMKHQICMQDRIIIEQRLNAVAQIDSHATNGIYEIRSLYFDNLYDKALVEKINGYSRREKFRIRYYNGDTSFIHLEKKSKIHGLCNKQSCMISAKEVQAIIDGQLDWMPYSDRELIKELYTKMKGQGLRPRTIVDYTRIPYVYKPGNVRVTLDYNIRTGMQSTDFLNWNCVTVPAAGATIILEVKWDEYLPDIIRDSVQLTNRASAAFSKYAVCRIYG